MLRVVVGAAVVRDGERVLVAQRTRGSHLSGCWEFPGGKAEPGETPAEAVRREVLEEVGLEVGRLEVIDAVEHAYEDRVVELTFFSCAVLSGEVASREGQALRWVRLSELAELEMPPANLAVVQKLVAGGDGETARDVV